jgi:hypothetical protein
MWTTSKKAHAVTFRQAGNCQIGNQGRFDGSRLRGFLKRKIHD